jgi:ribosomal protein S18 acetylase RimI-like enzyme
LESIHQFLKVESVRKTEHLYFNLLNFQFFKNSERGQALFFGSPKLLSHVVAIPYILALEIVFFGKKRHFVKSGERVVGMFVLREKSDTLYISSLAVAPEYRRLGIATYILKYANAWARRLNKKWLELGVSKLNAPALRLYRKFGFAKKEERKWSLVLKKDIENP